MRETVAGLKIFRKVELIQLSNASIGVSHKSRQSDS